MPKIMEWPSNSPDIKNLCRETSQQLLVKKKAITKDFFREIIQKEWDGVETETFVVPGRLEEIIAKNGNKINY